MGLRKRELAWTREQIEALLTAEVEKAGGEIAGPFRYTYNSILMGQTRLYAVHVSARMPAAAAKRTARACSRAQWASMLRGLVLLQEVESENQVGPINIARQVLHERIKARIETHAPEPAGPVDEEVRRNFDQQRIDIWLTAAEWRLCHGASEAAACEAAQRVIETTGKK